MDLSNDELLTLSSDAAVTSTESPPEAAAVVAAIVGQESGAGSAGRHAGWSRPAVSGITPLDAFVDTAAEFGSLLDSLAPADWRRRTRVQDGADVRQLVEHLVGMERYVLGALGAGPAWAADRREDHWPVTRSAAADVVGLHDEDVLRQWWREVLRVVAVCSERGPDTPVRYHHLAGSVHGLLVSRTFELWSHGDDIRQAVELPLNPLDDDRLGLMVGELMRALPIGMALTGQGIAGRSARFVLDGPGGGTFSVPLAFGESPAAEPDIVVSARTIDLCRLAANRLAADELGATVEGDTSLLEPVLAAAGAFAAD
jgi:uncharacterized protein (TIGR03083 family)